MAAGLAADHQEKILNSILAAGHRPQGGYRVYRKEKF